MVRAVYLFVALFVSLSSAAAQWMDNGKPVPDTPSRKAWGEHGAMLFLTSKHEELFEAWEKPGARVPVVPTDVVKRGDNLVSVVFFSGCAAGKDGKCDAEAVFQAFHPDGSPYGEEQKCVLWRLEPPQKGQLQLGEQFMGVRIEPKDPLGVYTVRAKLHDRIADTKVELTQTFRVEADAKPDSQK